MSSQKWIIIDLETTGLNPQKGDVIIDIAAIKGDETGITDTFQSFVHPGKKDVSPFVHVLTGISMETLQNARPDSEVLPLFKEFLGDTEYTIIGHNIGFDVDFLRYYGIQLSSAKQLDTNDFATLFFPNVPSHSLEVLADLLQVEHKAKHTALGDVHATYELLRAMLSIYKDKFASQYAHWLPSLLEKIPTWGGKEFFEMSLPPRAYDIVETSTAELTLVSHPEYNERALFIIPEYLEREQILIQAAQKQSGVLLLSNTAIDLYKSKAARSEGTVLFDSPHSFVSRKKIKDFLAKESFDEKEAMFAIRAHTLPDAPFLNTYTLPLTYRERGLISAFTVDLSTEKDAFTTFIRSHKTIITTFYHYFLGELASDLQETQNIVIGSTSELVPDIVKCTRSMLDEDSFVWKTQKLRDIFQNSEAFSSIGVLRDLEALEHVVKYFFQYIEKECKRAERRIFIQQIEAYVPAFVASVQKAEGLIRIGSEHLDEKDSAQVQRILDRVLDEVALFLKIASEKYLVYVEYYNNAAHIIREHNAPEQLLAQITAKNCTYTDSRYLPAFPYHISFAEQVYVGEELSPQNRKVSIHVEATPEFENAAFLEQKIPSDKKSVLLMGSATKCERIFDYMYEHMSNKDFVVFGQGKSGGNGKIAHLFEAATAGLLIQRIGDLKVHRLPTTLSNVLLSTIPFYIVQGVYFEKVYDRKVFGSLTLPLTLKCISDILDRLERKHTPISVAFFDERFVTKGYGQEIIEFLSRSFPID